MRWRRRKPKDSDFERELRAHLDLEAEEQNESGVPIEEAGYAARRALGNTTLVKESLREAWGWNLLETFAQDLRYTFRGLRRSPVFTVVAISSLAFGIGANTAIFSFVNALLLKRLPVRESNRLMQISEYEDGKLANTVYSYPFIAQLSKGNPVFDGILGRFAVRVNMSTAGSAEPLSGEVVTGDFFTTLRVKPFLGRLLTQLDIDAGPANPVCVISYETWQERFAGDPGIVGRKLMLNGHAYAVIGVTERGFAGSALQGHIDLQLPLSRMSDFMGGFMGGVLGSGGMWKAPGFRWLEPLARLKPGISMAQAQAGLNPLARSIERQLADKQTRGKLDYRLTDGSRGAQYNSSYREPVTVLMGVVALVLLIACANLANLLLARASARSKEFAVRLSLGASRGRVLRQLMVENLVMAAAGGLLGLLLAVWIIHTLLAYLNSGLSGNSALKVAPDPLVVGFLIALSLLTALLFGLVPAWQSARPELVPELKGVASDRRDGQRIYLRRSLIVFQISLSLMLLFTAGLLTRTLRSLKTTDLGFRPQHVVSLSVDPAMNGYPAARSEQLFDDIVTRLRSQPGIVAASVAVVSPLAGGMIAFDFEVPGRIPKSSDRQASFNMVSPDYFKTVGQEMLAGRDFDRRDSKKAPHVAIVDQLFLSQYMPGVSPVGRSIKIDGTDTQIVGIVRNARYQSLREIPGPLVYLPAKQTQNSGYTLLVRTRPSASATITDIEHTIHSVDAHLPIYDVRTLEDQIDQGMSSERVLSFLSTLFSGLATLLCSIGLYGIVAYSVSRRTREIGVRFAIGAQRTDVASLFFHESVVLVAAGIVFGIPAALASARLLKSLLYGVASHDIQTLSVMIAVLMAAGLLATVLPVWKAARIEPLQALRHE